METTITDENTDLVRRALFAASYTKGGRDFDLLFKRVDVDHSGGLGWDEFHRLVRSVARLGPKEVCVLHRLSWVCVLHFAVRFLPFPNCQTRIR